MYHFFKLPCLYQLLALCVNQSVVVVVVEDFGSWVSPPSLNCLLAPCPSTLTRLALWAELFQQKIQSTVALADRREPTVRLLMVQLQLAVKEGTIGYSIPFYMLYLLPAEAVKEYKVPSL